MKEYQLGEFEEVVLLTVAILGSEAYGVSIRQEIEDRLRRTVSVGALQTALKRMESKGFLDSTLGEATAVRGGKRKRYYTVTHFGKKAMAYTRDSRNQLWEAIPDFALDYQLI